MRTGLDIEIPNMLDKGMIYIGSSAGAMVCSPTLEICEWYIGEEERGSKYLPGINLVDFDFYPHWMEYGNKFKQLALFFHKKTRRL
jgi:peptidase E